MGCPCDKILQVAEHWGVAGRSPGQSSLAAVSAGFLSYLCICNIFVRSHPLCPKWAAAPWHAGAKSKKINLRFLLNPCCSLGCHCSHGASMHPRNKYAKKMYMRRMFAMGRKSVVTLDCFGFCNIWNNVLRHAHRISPCFRIVFLIHDVENGAPNVLRSKVH